MRAFFAGALVFAALLYAAAELTLDRPVDDGVIRLRWATDPNPARNLQVEIFGKCQVRLTDADILDWRAFGASLGRLAERLDPNAAEQVRTLASVVAEPGRRAGVLAGLNALMDRRDLVPAESLADLALSRDAKLLLERPRNQWSVVEVVALNRRVVEALAGQAVRPAQRIEAAVESGAREKLIVQCATGVGPDVIDVGSQAQMSTLVGAGVLVDLTPLASRGGFGVENTYPAIRNALQVEGKQYRYPCNVWANCVIYNREILRDHGLADPDPNWTYDDLARIGKQIVSKPGRSGAKHLCVANYNNIWMFDDFLVGHGGEYFTPDGLTCLLDSPEAVAALTLYHDLMHVHKIIPTPGESAAMSSQGGWGTGGINWFSTGRAAVIFIGRWYLCQAPNYPALRGKLGAVRLPRVPGRASAGACDTRAAGINVTSPNRQAALKFLRYLATSDYGKVIVHDGDSLPPNPALARTGSDLVNSVAPDPAFHQPFIDALRHARPFALSPFIDGAQVERWVRERLDKVENKILAPPEALEDLADEINRRIGRNIERRSDLQRKFRKVTGRDWTPDWRGDQARKTSHRASGGPSTR